MIFVDTSVGSADVIPLLERFHLKVEPAKLEYADVEFVGKGIGGKPTLIGVELKRLSELTGDYDRLAGHQIPKMLPNYEHRWLVWEGEWIVNKEGVLCKRIGRNKFKPLHGQSNAAALRKKLLTLEMCGGMHVQHTESRSDTVRFLVDLYRWWTDDAFDEHKSHIVNYQPHGIIPLNKFQQAFASLPRLSTKRCKPVARYFKNSLRRAAMASVTDWAGIEIPADDGTVRRLGTKDAQAIERFLSGEE